MSLRNFMTTQPREIGSISTTPQDKSSLAIKSQSWKCRSCGANHAMMNSHLRNHFALNNQQNHHHHLLNASLTDIDKIIKSIEDNQRTPANPLQKRLRVKRGVTSKSSTSAKKSLKSNNIQKQKLFLSLIISSIAILVLKFLRPLNSNFIFELI